MLRILLVSFIVVPALELWGLITVGKWIGGWTTVALVILTGVFGVWLARQQGLETLRLIQLQLSRGELPGDALLDGLLIIVGGVLLMTPGFFTDLIGLVFLVPYSRMIVRHLLKQWLRAQIASGRVVFWFRR